jgi:hypothetical protein
MTRAYNTATTQQNSGGAVAGFTAGKNKIINGDFNIWQRGTSFSSINGIYTADRWLGATNKTVTVSQQTFTAGAAPVLEYEATYFLRIAQSAGGSYCAIQTRLEDVRLFAGQTITLSFWAKADATVANRAGIVQIFGTGGSANVDNYSSSYNITTSWARYTYTIALGSISGKTVGTNSYLSIQPILTEDALAHTIDIWGVQLEVGPVATPFQTATGTIQGELAACQRYYWRLTAAGNISNLLALGRTTTQVDVLIQHPVIMRIPPTALEYGGTTDVSDINVAGYNTTSLSFANASILHASIRANIGQASLAQGKVYEFGAVSGGFYGFSAEL